MPGFESDSEKKMEVEGQVESLSTCRTENPDRIGLLRTGLDCGRLPLLLQHNLTSQQNKIKVQTVYDKELHSIQSSSIENMNSLLSKKGLPSI